MWENKKRKFGQKSHNEEVNLFPRPECNLYFPNQVKCSERTCILMQNKSEKKKFYRFQCSSYKVIK